MFARQEVYLIRIAGIGRYEREPVLARKYDARTFGLDAQFGAEGASHPISLGAFDGLQFPDHCIWQDRETVGLPVRMALRLANYFTGSLPRHHTRKASREIDVDLTPESNHTYDASDIQASECLVMVRAVDQDRRLALWLKQRWKVIRAYPRLRSWRDASA